LKAGFDITRLFQASGEYFNGLARYVRWRFAPRRSFSSGEDGMVHTPSHSDDMTNEPGKVELSVQDLRAVARYAAESAQEALSIFEERHPGDRRPRIAVEAAWTFAEGAERTKLQRISALAAHRAAQEATSEAAREAARAAGHAAAAAYLHPLATSTQVKHILSAAAHAARAAELAAGGDRTIGAQRIEQARQRATPALVAVLRRYPAASSSGNRVAQLMSALDNSLRSL
jgi:hypothetical protein